MRERNRVLALVIAALLKFGLLFAAVTLSVVHPLSLAAANGVQAVKIPATIVAMMQWPPLATVLAGGVLALGVRFSARMLSSR